MEQSEQKSMDLNRETAMRLWYKSFGNCNMVKDFTGRIIAKGAYDDRNSKCGWNVDHILPQSKGGVTADHNLVCCHILTNDEKADRFPCFTANGIAFEIIKVQNHYEIRRKDNTAGEDSQNRTLIFYDSAAGIRYFKFLEEIQNKNRFVGTVVIYMYSVSNGALLGFLKKIFDSESIKFDMFNSWHDCSTFIKKNFYPENIKVVISNYDMSQQSDMSELLDKCVLANTYLSHYFLPMKCLSGFDIYYSIDCTDRETIFEPNLEDQNHTHFTKYSNLMFVNDLVLENTEAGKKINKDICDHSEYTVYNYVYTDLQKNLDKEVNGK